MGRTAVLTCWAACCAAYCVAGCSRQRTAAPIEPPLRANVGHVLGSPVDPSVPGGAAGDALVMTLRSYVAGVSSLPPGEPLAARGQLIIDSASEPMATAPPVVESVRLVADGSSLPAPKTRGKGAVAVEEVHSPIPPGCTTVVSFVPNRPSRPARNPAPIRIAIVAPSAAGGDRPRLLATARPEPDAALTPGEVVPAPRERTILLGWPLDGPTGEFALIFPAAPHRKKGKDRDAGRATVFRVRIEQADGDANVMQASARILDDLNKSAQIASVSPGKVLASTLATASATPGMRGTVTAVCAEVQGDIALEAALLLDDKSLAPIAAAVAEALAAAPPEADTGQLGWLADRALLAALAKMSAGGEVPGGVRAMLSARFGEVGRDVGAVAELAAASASRADFDTRIRAENVILLDDASPAARVRAFEWARRQDAAGALKDYDPLGPAPKRRQAIDHYLNSLSASTQHVQEAADAAGGRRE